MSSKGSVPGRGSPAAPLRASAPDRKGDRRAATYAVLARIETADADEAVATIAERARAGDNEAFAELYITFFHRVHRYLTVALKSPEDADDVAQQVFTRVLEALPRDPLREPFRAWLFRLVRNYAIDHHRKHNRTSATAADELARNDDALTAAAAVVASREGTRALQDMIQGLPVAQKRVLILRYVYDFKPAEVAEALGTTTDSVRHIQMRALRTLAAKLDAPPRRLPPPDPELVAGDG
jgi:RNA polymerase sigma-70 factor (ECF subfamily)